VGYWPTLPSTWDGYAAQTQARTAFLRAELAGNNALRMPRDILANRDYLPNVAARAWRWAPEMHEVADTLRAQQLPSDLALAAAAVLKGWSDDSPVPEGSPTAVLRRLHRSTHEAG
jgi:uncharacterized protein DUF1932